MSSVSSVLDSTSFWDAHEAWKVEQLASPVDSLVSDPEESGSFLTTYTTYRVTTAPHRWSVRRRFSDFEWLRDVLTKRYVGLLVPALPTKKAIGKTGSGFVRERMAGLNLFLARLHANPYLRKDVSVLLFLSVAVPREWEAAKDSTKPSELSPDNTGMVKWREALEHYTLPPDADRTIAGVKAKLEALEPVFREAAASAKRLAEKSAAFSSELSSFYSVFEGVRQGETGHRADADAASADDPSSAAALLEKAGMGVSAWTKVAEFQPRMISSMIATTFAFEARQIAGMRHLLRQRDDMLAARHKAERTFDKHAADLSAVRGRSASKESAKARQVADDRVTLERAGFVVDTISKALLFSELDRLSNEKAELIRHMFAQYSVSGFRLAQRQGQLWKTMSTQMGISADVAAAMAKRSLDMFAPPSSGVAGAGAGAGAAGSSAAGK